MYQLTEILIVLLIVNASSLAAPQGQPQAGAPLGATTGTSVKVNRRTFRDWRRGDPTLVRNLGNRDSLGNAQFYIILALCIGFVSVVVGCWLSDNCWSPEPETCVTLA
ncbi:uncharacterized protein [Bemisia tabaci]|uniref:uncharacterized protein isoform X2 n=1 Tax=Bemisia tabaci TaxID=7038 RepID=UPI0008F9E2CA|nr:PREDICTED: uncharacterized protein LOC109039665 isoform X2 [Bemisia tabaci]